MKTITIPERFGYPTVGIIANGKHYTLNSGVEITVEDHIAEIIENAIALAPKIGRNKGKLAQLADGSITEITESDLDGIETIASYAFAYCREIAEIFIPNSVKSMGTSAFVSCKNLKSVHLPETPPDLASINTFNSINASCVFYCKTQASLDAYKAAANWSTLTGTYSFVVE